MRNKLGFIAWKMLQPLFIAWGDYLPGAELHHRVVGRVFPFLIPGGIVERID